MEHDNLQSFQTNRDLTITTARTNVDVSQIYSEQWNCDAAMFSVCPKHAAKTWGMPSALMPISYTMHIHIWNCISKPQKN